MKKTYHFIGLGGVGMSALARLLLQMGYKVQGSDAVESDTLEELRREGAEVKVGHRSEAVPQGATVVYSSSIGGENVELVRAKQLHLPLLHRSDLLQHLMQPKEALLVTGTHGKTTTTALLAAVFVEAGLDPTFCIGGTLCTFNTNARAGRGRYFIAEGDESDGSFLKSAPLGAIVTNLDDDHLDYWESREQLGNAFAAFMAAVKDRGKLFWCGDDVRLASLVPPGLSYGFSDGVDLKISSFVQQEKGISFDLAFRGKCYSKIELNALFGEHNALNAAAVFGLSLCLGVSEAVIRRAFKSFSGIARRLELKGEAHSVRLFDDYGHHPTEIRATLRALRCSVHERRLVVLFQPHRYTRVKELFDAFLSCFDEADEVILTDIYSAGEPPIEGISSAALYLAMRERLNTKMHFIPRSHLEEEGAALLKPLDVLLTLGAGDITLAGEPILRRFAERAPKLKVALLTGGTSAEHDIALMSAKSVLDSLDPSLYQVELFGITKEGYWLFGPDAIDRLKKNELHHFTASRLSSEVLSALMASDVCIPIFHGPQGEDGMVQGFLDTLQIPYVGCDYRASALCMQKSWTKQIALLHNVPTLAYVEIDYPTYRRDPEKVVQKVKERLSYPVWVKPVHLGSSLGVSRADTKEELLKAIDGAFALDEALIIEEHLDARQIEMAVLGNEQIRIAAPCEILDHGTFYSFDVKYGPKARGVDIPAKLSETELKIVRELAEKMYRAVGCRGWARVDFFLDRDGHFWLNEINPIPGCTCTSGYPKAWEESGMSFRALSNELVALSLQRSRTLN